MTERILKVAHVYPLGDYMLVSGVYVDRADRAFAGLSETKRHANCHHAVLIGGVIALFSKAIGQQVQSSLQALNRITQRNLSQSQKKVLVKMSLPQIDRAVEETRNNLAQMLLQQQEMSLSGQCFSLAK